jgi:SAM-dependent methyltransferase
MTKEGEINYLKNIGKDGIIYAMKKPFSDIDCGGLLGEIGAIISLLPAPPKRILDIGCGTGWTSIFLAKRGYDVVGIDISRDMIKYAKIKKEEERINNLQFLVEDYENILFNNEFDCVIFFDSLHHAEDEKKAIEKAYQSLKPGGICIFSEPGRGHKNTKLSIDVMKKYNVNEKDMPPNLLIKYGKKIGFTKFNVYPKPKLMMNLLYSPNEKFFGFNSRLFETIFKLNIIRNLAIFFLMIFKKYHYGIVLMKK